MLREFRYLLIGRQQLAIIMPEHQLALQAAEFRADDGVVKKPENAGDPSETLQI